MDFRFDNPWYALLLVPVVIGFLHSWRQRHPSLRVSAVAPFREASRGRGSNPVRWTLILEALGSVLLVVALMRPQTYTQEVLQRAEGLDIVIALDVSGSMRAHDLGEDPRSITRGELLRRLDQGELKPRIETAKEELERFVSGRPNDRIGLIVFSEAPYVVCPPTLDRDFLLGSLERVEAGMLPGDGTNIAGPIASATARLKESDAPRRLLVLITDGANTVDAAVTPVQAARIAKTFDTRIYTVAIGGDHPFLVQRGYRGPVIRWPPMMHWDPDLLNSVAAETDGRFLVGRDAKGFREAMAAIDRMETVELEVPKYRNERDWFLYALGTAAGLTLLGHLLASTWLLRCP